MILVTGACSNTGQYVIPKLLENGLEVLAINHANKHMHKIASKMQGQHRQGKLQFHWINFVDTTETGEIRGLEDVFKQHLITGVIHIAFIIPPWSETDPEHARKVNVEGTRQLIQLTEKYAQEVPFIFSSSTTVFGPVSPNEIYIDETHATTATSNYTTHKLACEQILKNSRLDWKILRFSAIMNPTFKPSAEEMAFAKKISLKTHFEPVHVKDVATAVYHALIRKNTSRKTFIISGGSKTQMTFREYIFNNLKAVFGDDLKQEDVPWELFLDKPYYLHWYNTKVSQEILTYQERTMDDYIREARVVFPWWKKILLSIIGIKRALRYYLRSLR